MELLSNLVWAAVIAALWTAWLTCRRSGSVASQPSRTAIQLIGLAMLSAILLPVISVTDDLHACDIPAEVERVCTWNHRQSSTEQAPRTPSASLAILAISLQPSRLHAIAFLTAEKLIPRPQSAHGPLPWYRPPPAA
ncbi:MAG: hypothetical protein WBC92_13715 [Terracidiphilus sp.]